MDSNPIPYAARPRRALFLAIAKLLEGDDYLRLSRDEFIAQVMKATHGSARPSDAAELFDQLRAEAGVV